MTVSPASKPGATPGAQVRHLKKGDRLFLEGDLSRAMYLVRTGMIRVFKKRGESQIEIDTIRAGQILGELAFLDGNPRSASAEAITDVELLEISGPLFQNVLLQIPEWMKLLLKTVVGRLRTASNRIRQLEQSSTAIDYSDKDQKKSSVYVFIGFPELMKLATALVVVSAQHGESVSEGVQISQTLLTRYSNQILGVPLAKLTAFLDILAHANEVKLVAGDESKIVVVSPEFIEKFIFYMNDENMLDPAKRHDLTARQEQVLGCVVKHIDEYPKDPSGLSTLNLASIKKSEKIETGKEPFALDELNELVRLGYLSQLKVISADEMVATAKPEFLLMSHRIQRINVLIQRLNEQKRKN